MMFQWTQCLIAIQHSTEIALTGVCVCVCARVCMSVCPSVCMCVHLNWLVVVCVVMSANKSLHNPVDIKQTRKK